MEPIKLTGKKIALAYAKYMIDLLSLKFDTAGDIKTSHSIYYQLQNARAMLERVKKFYGVK